MKRTALLLAFSVGFFTMIPEQASAQDPEWSLSQSSVGIGTGDPEQKLHVQGAEQTRLLVENTNPEAAGDQTMFELRNASGSKVRFAITSAGDNIWTFDNNPSANSFSISKVGTGLNEFLLTASGDGTFRGVSLATQHVNTSSRKVKTDFGTIDSEEVLNKLASLPVTQWRYRSEDKSVRHIGPVAEEFQETFGLGDGKTISTVDASGIAFAAIQGLNEKLAASNSELESKILEQEKRILQLEAALTRMLEN